MKLTTEGKRGVPRRIPGQYPRGSNARTRRPGIRGTRPGLSRARRRRRPRPSASGIWKGRFSSREMNCQKTKSAERFFLLFCQTKQRSNRVGSQNTRVCVAVMLPVFRDLMPAYDWRRSDWTTSNKIQARSSNRPQSARHNDRRRGLSSAAGQQARENTPIGTSRSDAPVRFDA